MDWSTIVVAILALVGSLSGTYFANQKTTALMAYRIQQLEEKVHKHNNLVERMYAAERDIKEIKEKMEAK